MHENSLAQAHVHAATVGQFLMAPVKSVDVDDEEHWVQLFMKQKKIIVYSKFLLAKTCQRKDESTPTE